MAMFCRRCAFDIKCALFKMLLNGRQNSCFYANLIRIFSLIRAVLAHTRIKFPVCRGPRLETAIFFPEVRLWDEMFIITDALKRPEKIGFCAILITFVWWFRTIIRRKVPVFPGTRLRMAIFFWEVILWHEMCTI